MEYHSGKKKGYNSDRSNGESGYKVLHSVCLSWYGILKNVTCNNRKRPEFSGVGGKYQENGKKRKGPMEIATQFSEKEGNLGELSGINSKQNRTSITTTKKTKNSLGAGMHVAVPGIAFLGTFLRGYQNPKYLGHHCFPRP